MKKTMIGGIAVAWILVAVGTAHAQGRLVPPPPPSADSATVVPGPRYAAGPLHRWLLGSDWRELWQVPLTLPVLDVETFAGGLEPEEEGGNMQSITLHMTGEDGRDWIFRSLDKYPEEKLGVGGLAEVVVQDQISSLHPAGQLVVPALLEAVDILHVSPTLYVMPDDPALGEFRERFAGMVGALEFKPNEGEDDTPGTFGSTKIVDAMTMLDRLEESVEDRVDQRQVLRARLMDFIIGDTDRASDQWRFARFADPDHPDRTLWRPVPRDRDWVFVGGGDGQVVRVLRMFYPKLVGYGPDHAPLEANTFSSHVVDRSMLTGLERATFDAEVAYIQRHLTDGVIEDAVGRLPAAYPEAHRRFLAESLRARRDALAGAAHEFYAWLASEVDVRGTDEDDRAEILRREDGRLEVTLSPRSGGERVAGSNGGARAAPAPYYHRVFEPGETNEVRVFLHGGDDVAVVRGPSDDIRVRVLGGGGDDLLADSTAGRRVHLYDSKDGAEFVRGRWTDVDRRDWEPPPTPEGVRVGSDWAPDWGGGLGFAPAIDFGEYAGVIVGVGAGWTDYGFRRLPHHRHVSVTPLYAIGANKFGIRLGADYRPENSLHSLELDAEWVDFDAIRWYGLGNASPDAPSSLSLVPLNRVRIRPSAVLRFGTWRADADDEGDEDLAQVVIADESPAAFRGALEVGPVATYTDPEPRFFSPFAGEAETPTGRGWEAGLRALLRMERVDRSGMPRRGFRLSVGAEGYPAAPEGAGEFATAGAEARGYLPLPLESVLALRAGGRGAFGQFPAWHAAMLGGRTTLRGFEWQRFAGDAAAYGGAELRVPLGTVSWIARGGVGVLGLADAGRVWLDGESRGGWHAGYGGGVWLEAVGRALSVYYATGEGGHLYLSMGMPF